MAKSINLDTAQRVDITCRRNDTFELNLTIKDGTSSAFAGDDTFKMQVRSADDEADTVVPKLSTTGTFGGTFFTAGVDGFLAVDTADYANGVVKFKGLAADMDVDSGLYVYDIQFTDVSAPKTSTLLYGTFKINEDVTI
jgi:hypothetical protein